MWETDSLWFEIALVSFIYAMGNILMGHFEERTPKIRRVGKYLLTLKEAISKEHFRSIPRLIIVCCLSFYFGRVVSMIFLASFIIPLLWIHGYYLPKKKGINVKSQGFIIVSDHGVAYQFFEAQKQTEGVK